MVRDYSTMQPGGEFSARLRFVRQLRTVLLGLPALWLLVALPLWLANRHRLHGVRTLAPAEMRLAMPETDYQIASSSFYSPYGSFTTSETDPRLSGGPLRVMGRGLVRLDANGSVAWEVPLSGNLRLATAWGGSDSIRVLGFDPATGDCTVSAISAGGELLWQLPLQTPLDSLASVGPDGTLAVCGESGNVAWISADGKALRRFQLDTDMRHTQPLPDAGRFMVEGGTGRLRCWTAAFEPDWEYTPDDGTQILFAATAGQRIIARDRLMRLHCLDGNGNVAWKDSLPPTIADAYGTQSSNFHAEEIDGFTILFFNTSDWMVISALGERLWHGQGYPYFGYPGDVSASENFISGPDGRRVFKAGTESVYCVDSQWRELWSLNCGPSGEVVSSDDERLVVHVRDHELISVDWDGNEQWSYELGSRFGLMRVVSSAGGLTTFRTIDNRLSGINSSGELVLDLELAEGDEYNVTKDGEYIYVRNSNQEIAGYNWLLDDLRRALDLSERAYVDCYDKQGERLWRALLPERMDIDRLHRQPDGSLAVVAYPQRSYAAYGGYGGYSSSYETWEFIFRQPQG